MGIVVTDDELFCLIWTYSQTEAPGGIWWVIDGDSPWEHLRERNLLEVYKTRVPITRDYRKQVLYQITPEGSAYLSEIETSRMMAICSERKMLHLLIPFIDEMGQEELPELIAHSNALIRKTARERCDEIHKRGKCNRLVRRGIRLWRAGK